MSDYFGALMRASGIAIGVAADIRRALPHDGDRVGLEATLDQTDRAQAPSARNVGDDNVRSRQAPADLNRNGGAASDAADLLVPAEHGSPHAHEPVGIVPPAALTPLAPTLPDSVDTTAYEPQANAAQALLQTALRWVTTGEATAQQPAEQGARSESRESLTDASALVTERAEIAIAPALAERDATRVADANEPIRAAPAARLQATAHEPLESGLRASRSDAIEVSIGAIHVRVDAPPAQTVARPAAPPALPIDRAPAASRAPHSSRLARRALRRI